MLAHNFNLNYDEQPRGEIGGDKFRQQFDDGIFGELFSLESKFEINFKMTAVI